MPRSVMVTCSITSAIYQTDGEGLKTHVVSEASVSAAMNRSAESRKIVTASPIESIPPPSLKRELGCDRFMQASRRARHRAITADRRLPLRFG